MKENETGNQIKKTFETESNNRKISETRITGAIVFKGSVNLLNQILLLVNSKGEVIYQRITSPNRKLWIKEED